MRLTPVRLLASLALVPVALLAQGGPPQAAAPAGPTAEQTFKNIKVFTGKPASQLRPTMTYIADALGVQCNYCHDTNDFAADTKNEKATAREMVTMVFTINKDDFRGQNRIACFTCHQGHSSPQGNLPVATAAAMEAAAANNGRGGPGGPGFGPGGPGGPGGRGQQGPAVPIAQVLDKYVAALGGQAAVDAVKSMSLTATRVMGEAATPETIARQGGKFTITDTAPNGAMKSGFDGTAYFNAGPGGREEAPADVQAWLQLDSEFFPGLALRTAQGARVQGPRMVDGRNAYVAGVRAGNVTTSYYFDADSGLLFRFTTSTPTILGSLPLQVDFADYKPVNGVQIPFTVTYANASRIWQRKVTAVQVNVPVEAGAGR